MWSWKDKLDKFTNRHLKNKKRVLKIANTNTDSLWSEMARRIKIWNSSIPAGIEYRPCLYWRIGRLSIPWLNIAVMH